MKTPRSLAASTTIAALFGSLALASTSSAAIIGINPTSSFAQFGFLDTNSLIGATPGTTNLVLNQIFWTGALFSMPLTTDGVTGDTASGNLAVSFLPTSPVISAFDFQLAQLVGNTGFAEMGVQFTVQYQLDTLGLPITPTYAPPFILDGTVQAALGSFAKFSGTLEYYGVVGTDGVAPLLDTVTYSYVNTTAPSTFSSVAVPGLGGTTIPALASGTTFTMVGSFKFVVDPASISSTAVPEPSACLLALAAAPLLALRRKARK